MSVPAWHEADADEFIVTPAIADALRSQGIRLAAGLRVRLILVAADPTEPPRRRWLDWLGSVTTGKGNLGERTKDDVRAGMGRSAE
ncbi:MAG: hypothetical protein ACRDRK_27255 [Pseudonocardia sp.]